jgi:hypothetical protein
VIFEDQLGVSEPVTRLGSINGAGLVDGAAQHCASEPRRPSARRIMLSSPQRFGTDRRSSKAPSGLTFREATDLTYM